MKQFEGDSLEQLANSILQPLTVRKLEFGYELIAGERRLRASKSIGLSSVPCIIMNISERNSAVMALVENIQRKDLNFFEEAFAIKKLIEFYGMTQEDAAVKLGKSQSEIANKLRLLRLNESEMQQIVTNNLTECHSRAFLKLKTSEERLLIIDKIVRNNLNVEQTELAIDTFISCKMEKENFKKRSGAFKNVKIFLNTINQAIDMMKAAGINPDSVQKKEDDCIEYIIRIPI